MKRHLGIGILMALAFCVVSFKLGQATQMTRFDATFWRALPAADQLEVVEGLIDGYEAGYWDGEVRGSNDEFDHQNRIFAATFLQFFKGPSRAKDAMAYLDVDAHVRKTQAAKAPVNVHFPQTFKSYIDGITDYYDNNPSDGDKSPAAVISCLSTLRPSICKNGHPE